MKYTIELTDKQKKVMDCLLEIIHRYIGFNPKFEMYREPEVIIKTVTDPNANAIYEQGFEDGKNEARKVKVVNVEDTNEYQIGYKTGYDIAQTNAQATKEEWGKIEYGRGFEDGKNEAIHNTELIPELKKCNYTLGYDKALEDVSNLIAFYDYHFMREYYPEELGKGYTLCNLNDKYGLAEVLKNWKTYTKQKKEVEKYHKVVNTLRTVIDEYPRETIINALSEFGIEVKE